MTTARSPLVPSMLLLALLLAGGAGTAYALGWLGGEQGAAPPAPAPVSEPADVAPPGPRPEPAVGHLEVLTPEAAGVDPADCIVYPDGTRLPPLNGVTKAPRVVFHRMLPYTKVVGRRVEADGTEWYVHENGAWSTTRFHLRNGVREAVGEVQMPAASQGVVDDK